MSMPTSAKIAIVIGAFVISTPILAALAIFGVNRYLKNAKTAEAKTTVAHITRAAIAAYNRENISGTHALCTSAGAVPRAVPSAKKYMPAIAMGQDFLEGDAMSSWRCLRFEMTMPMYYQYEYRVGGNYKGPARGGPDPGPNGFEASAEGDLDGDGITSLFTMVGQVQNGTIVSSKQIFIADEFE